MSAIDKLNYVVSYIESHLCEDIDLEELSRSLAMSAYDLQRMFSFVAEISISEYARNRRLSLAGVDLKFSDCKVIDIAMKYGYNSATSFSRAFTAFHGVTPGTVRKADAALRAFPKITFQISIKEEIDAMRKDKLTVKGKQYDALYFGEVDMSAWSVYYKKTGILAA